MRKEYITFLLVLFISFKVQADYVSNRFFVTDKKLDFSKTIRSGKCYGTIPYPYLSHNDEELFIEINDEIHDFVEIYVICNKGKRDNYSVKYDVPESGSYDYFSVRWLTNKDKKLWRIDSLNFNIMNGDLLKVKDIFNPLARNMFEQIIKLSQGHLSKDTKWEEFLDKIDKRDIQFYLVGKEWHLVFNATDKNKFVVDVEIPEYFLKGDDVTNAR